MLDRLEAALALQIERYLRCALDAAATLVIVRKCQADRNGAATEHKRPESRKRGYRDLTREQPMLSGQLVRRDRVRAGLGRHGRA
jgi:hypothetical protein